MNLTIDQGNSRTKVVLFDDQGRIKKTFIYKSFSSADVERLFSLYPIEASIIASVVNIDPAVVNALVRLSQHFVLFDHHTPVPLKNGYETPETLGLDRLAAAVGAASICPQTNLLIVDAGSAITYDFVSAEGVFLGGNIAPGISMRLKALHMMTKKLPLVEADEAELIPLIAKNTRDAIVTGVVRGVAYEVRGYISALDHGQVFITGGHAPYILHNLHSATPSPYHTTTPSTTPSSCPSTTTSTTYPEFLHPERHLVLIGLNKVLKHNLS